LKVTCENIFVGARISKDGKFFSVVKVNQKSFYAADFSYDEYLEKWDVKSKGVTFKEFCKVWDIKSYKYTDLFEITEEEFGRKDKIQTSCDTYKLDYRTKKSIVEQVDNAKKKGRVKLLQFDVGQKTIRILEVKDENLFLNIDGDYVLFSLSTKESIKVGTVFDYKEKEIPWNKLSAA